ncbi:MAG: universal stress protein [Deltaproteobacteria bacterium]|nr:universal stress protein [Deltaproteobacteria bacterium]
MSSSIVFGTTLAADREPDAEVAALLARRMDVRLRLVHVTQDPRAPVVLGTDEEHILGPVRATLEREAARLRALTGADVHVHLAAGAIVNALVSVARFDLAKLLVLGGGGDAGGRVLLGTTAERVSRKSVVPVLTLRDAARLEAWLRPARRLRVLVGTDTGRSSQAAREFAASLSSVGECDVEVVQVVSPPEVHARLGLPPPADEHTLSREAEDALMREIARTAPPGEVGVAQRVLAARGSADAHLVSHADRGDFDLVVVGQSRLSLLEQLWHGSVARGVLRAAPVSVACVPPPVGPPRPAFRAARVVVVGTDIDDVSEHALAQAMGTVCHGGTVHVAHVLSPTPGSMSDALRAREQAWHALSRALALDTPDERAVTVERYVLEGDAAEQLLALSDRVGADLIVLGGRGQSVLRRTLLGSVAQSVLAGARVPVLLVPAPPP